MARNDVGDIKESAMHQQLLTVVVVVVVTLWVGVSSQYRTALQFVNGAVTNPYYSNNMINSVTPIENVC